MSLNLSRTVFYYQAEHRACDTLIIAALDRLTGQYPILGFLKLYHILRKEGHVWNHKRVYRVYKAMKLNIRRKKKRRLPERVKMPLSQPDHMNHSWSMDFMSDCLQDGIRFRTLNIIDDFNREALTIDIDTSIASGRIIRCLERIIEDSGKPKQIRVDNGPEFTSFIFQQWCKDNDIHIHYIQPGKPTQNAFIERFNGSYRREILNAYFFNSIDEVREITQSWLWHYNATRPHEALNNLTPFEFIEHKQNLNIFELST